LATTLTEAVETTAPVLSKTQQHRKITLVMGPAGSGKTFLLNSLQKNTEHNTISIASITQDGLSGHISEIAKAHNVILTTEHAPSSYLKRQLVKVAKALSGYGKYVYIHCYPRDYDWLQAVWE